MPPGTEAGHGDYAAAKSATSLASLGQVLVNLTDANTRALLSDAAEELLLPERRAEAEVTLARLRQISPSVARHFRPKREALATIPLRMVCSPRPEFVSSFIAVSYCWHYPEWPISPHARPIAPGWGISEPMMHAIMQQRQSEDEGIWMDQLCINQEHAEEKITHIGAMDIIYRSARRVLILLEDVQLAADEISAGLVYVDMYKALIREVRERNLDGSAKADFMDTYFPQQEQLLQQGTGSHFLLAVRSFAVKMVGARWYSRAWCAHESRTAPHRKVNNPLFLVYAHDGTVISFEFRFIHYLCYYLCDSEPAETVTSKALATSMQNPNPTTLRHRWWRMGRLMPERRGGKSPMQHLVSILSFGCQKKGDLVSIALNTWEMPLIYEGELNTVEQAIVIFSLLAIASGDLTPLVMTGAKLRVKDEDTGKQMVSWLVHPLQGVLDSRMSSKLTDAITELAPEYIELDLLVFTSLPKDATPESFQKAATIIEQYNLLDLYQDITATADTAVRTTVQSIATVVTKLGSGRQGPLQTFHQRWLAVSLDCGLDWILGFADLMDQQSWDDWSYGRMGATADVRLVDAAHSLLELFDIRGDAITAQDFDKTVKFLTCVFDPRLLFFTISPRRLPVGPGPADSAIVTTVSNRSWVAVPTAVAHLPSWQERAWIIEPLDSWSTQDPGPLLTSDFADGRVKREDWSGKWQLKRRERIFGTTLLPQVLVSGSNEHVIHLKRQRVYGSEDYDWQAAGIAARDL